MKTEANVLDDLRTALTGSTLDTTVTGNIYTDKRPLNSKLEDIFIRVKALDFGQVQRAIIGIYIYVPNLKRGSDSIPNRKRARTLMSLAVNLLHDYQAASGWRLRLTDQKLEDAADEEQSVIVHNLIYSHCNN